MAACLRSLPCHRLSLKSVLSANACEQLNRYVDRGARRQKWFSAEKPEAVHDAHSKLLTDKEHVYELQHQLVKPDHMGEYLDIYGKYVNTVNTRGDLSCELIGSWTVSVGDEDEIIHLWRYKNGYRDVSRAMELSRQDPEYRQFLHKLRCMLRSRTNQLLLEFSFWPVPEPRPPTHIYEMRSYLLKPGTMIEWGNNWYV
ncbi:PREDICTED: protein NipSnap-like [Priapulus caudatus]|uniref:Protein NipSnap-like n=1 Tax=Priapulus caudatus TaxID=37621 RepID=A0ABM1E0V4_PRICU|nr:PREDICTED: protein NipSnap-like [Priapulus caudatus]